MLELKIENSFKKDFKLAIKQNLIDAEVEKTLNDVIETLRIPALLEKEYRNHALSGDYKNYFDCHIKSDLVLVYRVYNNVLHLVRFGKHTTIFKKY